jgi:two-component system, chemotaxis family, sensor kinase CheA
VTEPDAELLAVFRSEAAQHLDEMDAALLAIESGAASGELIDSLFRHVHTIKGAAGMVGMEDVSLVAHAAEDVLAGPRESGTLPPGLADPLLRTTAVLRARVTGADAPVDTVLNELSSLSPQPLQQLQSPPPSAEPGGEAGPSPGARPPAAGSSGPVRQQRRVQVPAGRVDHLIDVVGEAVEDGRRLAHALGPGTMLPERVADVLSASERTLDELKDTAIRMRTLPLSAITGPLPRVVRDLARSAGKDVGFAVAGADTELDRVILESLTEPLMHLLRNAVAHGIEPAAERERAGKPARGRVELRAVPRGSRVEVVVADDGRGISPEVAERARHEGTLVDVLASAGYSTAGEVTELAGRGVGLDVVREYAHSLGGSLEIRSQPGDGMEIVLLLPLALALLEVLLFERGGALFGVPLATVEEVVRVSRITTMQGNASLDVRGRMLPVSDLAAVLGADAPPLPDRPPALVVTARGRKFAVACDALVGQEEVTVKPLGHLLAGVRGYLGATILGDGRIALLAEPAALIQGRPTPSASLRPRVPHAETAKILVVEDSFTVRELQRSILEMAGYRVETARDGSDALRVISREPGIALVITDLEMPGLDGLELTRAIRADPARASLPVVIVTSRGSEEDQRKGIEAGADAYVVKRNFNQQAMLATVERLVGR